MFVISGYKLAHQCFYWGKRSVLQNYQVFRLYQLLHLLALQLKGQMITSYLVTFIFQKTEKIVLDNNIVRILLRESVHSTHQKGK